MTVVITPATPPLLAGKIPEANFDKNKFDALVWDKGYVVILEKSLKCPCTSKNAGGQQSNCRNCGGTGWIFINPKETRMVLSSMNLNTKYQSWSKENVGTASITALSEDETSFMDRISVVDGIAIFNETLFLKTFGSTYYWATIYDIKEILHLALFINVDTVLKPLKYGIDFTYVKNVITFLTASDYIRPLLPEQDISIVIRYKHSPQFHIIDIPRETIQSFITIMGEGEQKINLPIHAVGRRSHYVLDRQNFDNSRILNNSFNFKYEDLNPPLKNC